MTTTRREFLATLGVAMGAVALPGCRSAAFASTAQPGKTKLSRIGIQLYTVRSLTQKDLDGTLAKIAGIGYKEVEFAGYFNRTPAQIRALLAANHLTSPSTHIGIPATDDAWKELVDDSREIGHEWIVVPSLDGPARKTVDDWRRTADRFNQLARVARQGGVKFGYHNHNSELARVGDGTALDILISNTDPSIVDFEMDIYWVVKGGGDPIALIDKYPHRFPLLHVKDATPAPELAMVDVGKGSIDFGRIFARARTSGMQHAFVEHDSPKDALETAAASYRHLASLEF